MRSTVRMLEPSAKSFMAKIAFSIRMVVSPSGFACSSVLGLAAIGAAETLQAVSMLAKATAFDLTIGANHRSGCFGLAHHNTLTQRTRKKTPCVYVHYYVQLKYDDIKRDRIP